MKKLTLVFTSIAVFASLSFASLANAQTSDPVSGLLGGLIPIVSQLIFFGEALISELLLGSRSPLAM